MDERTFIDAGGAGIFFAIIASVAALAVTAEVLIWWLA